METLKDSEAVINGLVESKQVVSKSFDLGKEECVESVCAPVAESGCIDPCGVNGLDRVVSSSHRGDPIKGISLYVELTGGVTNKPDRERIGDVGPREFGVNVGDLVWAVVKKQKQSWWPGIVCDASSAPKGPKEAAKRSRGDDVCLVRCFGNGSYIWCSQCEVKPFVGYFEELPSRSKAKRFLDALDKAVAELGHRVKRGFTCSCFSKMKMEKSGNLQDLLVTRFEPVTFVDYIKDLARDVSMPNAIDYVVKQNCLSAFYRSLGHLQIPMPQLRLTVGSPSKVKIEEENEFFNDDFEKSEISFQIRERRKSRSLSYPGKCGIEESMLDVNKGVDLNKSNQSQPVKKPRKKWSRKSKAVQVNICSAEALSQLQCVSKDCLFPFESKNFDVVERFISEFRKRAFTPNEMLNHQILQETLPKKVRRKDKSVISQTFGNDFPHGSLIMNFQNVGSANLEAQSMVNNRTEVPANQATFFSYGDLPLTQQRPCKLEPKRRKQNAENITSPHTWNADINAQPIVKGHLEGLYQAPVFHFTNDYGSTPPCFTGKHGEPQVGPVPVGLCHVPKKRGRKRKNIDLQTNSGSTIIPNLNKNASGNKKVKISELKQVGLPCIDLSYNKVQQDTVEVKGTAFLLKFSPDYPLPPIQDLNSVFSKYGALIESETQVSNENLSGQVVFLDSSSAGGAFWGLQNDKPFGPVLVSYIIQHGEPQLGLVQAGSCHVPKKRGRKRKNIDLHANSSSTITPILNENGFEKTQEKRFTAKEAGVPCIDFSNNKVQQDNAEEVKGTAFLLKFSPDYPLPSIQDLNSVFSKYGALIESETQVLIENLSGQVVFLDSSSAGGAFWELENDKPFGPVLVSYNIQHGEPQLGLVPAGSSHVPKKRGRKRKNKDLQANSSSIITPILNENGSDKKQEKRFKTKEVGVPCIDLSYNKVQQDNAEVKGTAFLLKFSSDYPLPSIQDLNSVFSKYGALNESETQVLNASLSGQVVFLDSSSAGCAFWGLQNDKPLGPVLVNYKIQHLSGAESMVPFKTPIKSPSGFKPMGSQALVSSAMTPDLNTNSTEIQIVKKSKTIQEIRLPSKDNLSYSKLHQSNGDVTGTALLLKFSPNHPLPSFQDLNSVFCKYGELNKFETQVSGQTFTGQVVFVSPSAAGGAIQRLEEDRPFGQALLSYQLHHLYNVRPAIQVKTAVNTPIKLQPCQDLGAIKKNLEMMNSMLEKAGDSLSPEMRGKLESEIKGLMKKVSAMGGSSSSSSSCL